MKSSYIKRVFAVVVTYQPNFANLEQLLDALILQVESIIVVDNCSHEDVKAWSNNKYKSVVKVLVLSENQGIAFAHNAGIQRALNSGAEFVLLMDQDSIPELNMVQNLSLALLNSQNQFESPVIAAGPICVDSRTGDYYFFSTERNGHPTRWRPESSFTTLNLPLKVSALISSGSLINLNFLKNIGGMRTNYFIDHVDTEWCFRAVDAGYILLGVPNAIMTHTLGDKIKNIWFFGWYQLPYHSPLRDYYMFRNTLLIQRDVNMSLQWRFYLLLRLLKFSIYFLIFTTHRFQRLYCMALGIIHGLLNTSGKVNLETGKCTKIITSNIDP